MKLQCWRGFHDKRIIGYCVYELGTMDMFSVRSITGHETHVLYKCRRAGCDDMSTKVLKGDFTNAMKQWRETADGDAELTQLRKAAGLE